jgi:hypothetical protein
MVMLVSAMPGKASEAEAGRARRSMARASSSSMPNGLAM